jgi:hypothetical protein
METERGAGTWSPQGRAFRGHRSGRSAPRKTPLPHLGDFVDPESLFRGRWEAFWADPEYPRLVNPRRGRYKRIRAGRFPER